MNFQYGITLKEMMTISEQIRKVELDRDDLQKKCIQLEKTIAEKNDLINKLRTELRFDRFKSHILTQLFQSVRDTGIYIDPASIIEEKEGEVHVYNYESGNIPVIVHDYLGEESRVYAITGTKKPQTFRGVKRQGATQIHEETPEELEEKVRKADEQLEEMEKEHLDTSYKQTLTLIESCFEEISKNRVCKKPMETIRENRSKLLSKVSLDQYVKLLKGHIDRLKGIFAAKKYDLKKITESIEKTMTPLEQRLSQYGQYFNTSLSIDEQHKLKTALVIHADYPTRYIPFCLETMQQNFYNYGLAVFTLKETFKRVFVNPYGFHNVVYIALDKSSPDDPYSFYVLEKIDGTGKRFWKMECRLDDFSRTLSSQLLVYSAQLFRRIYKDVFSDNIYRADYTAKATICKEDLQQLLSNIIALTQKKSLCTLLQSIVVKGCTLQPGNLDKFNFTGDDKIVKKQFSQDKDNLDDAYAAVRTLFDQITEDDIQSLFATFSETT